MKHRMLDPITRVSESGGLGGTREFAFWSSSLVMLMLLRTWWSLQSSALLAPSSHPNTVPPSTAPAMFAFSPFPQMHPPHSCFRAFVLAVSLAWSFPSPGILISRSFSNVSAYMLLPCPTNLIGSQLLSIKSPCCVFILFICLFVCVYLCMICFLTRTQTPWEQKPWLSHLPALEQSLAHRQHPICACSMNEWMINECC